MVGVVTLPSVVVVASLAGWVQVGVSVVLGAALSVIAVILLGVFEVTEQLRDHRREQKQRKLREEKEKEALESESGPTIEDPELVSSVDDSSQTIKAPPAWTPDKKDRRPEGSQLLDLLRRLRNDLRDLIDLGLSWVGLVYLFLLSAIWWLNSLMLRLGASKDAAMSAVVVDVVLVVLTGAWLLTGIRTRRRPIRTRLAETSVLVAVCLGAFALVAATGSVVYGGVCLFFGGVAFLKGFS